MVDPAAFVAKTKEEEVRRGNDAARILEDPLFKEACEHIERSLQDRRRAVPIGESAMHTRLILTEQLWCNLKDYLTQIAFTGKWAQRQLIEEEQRKRNFKLFPFRQ